MLLESKTFANGAGQRIEAVWRVGFPVGVGGYVVEWDTPCIVAPGAIIRITSALALRAFVTIG